MTDVYTAALLPINLSSDDDSGFRHYLSRSIITTDLEHPSCNSRYH